MHSTLPGVNHHTFLIKLNDIRSAKNQYQSKSYAENVSLQQKIKEFKSETYSEQPNDCENHSSSGNSKMASDSLREEGKESTEIRLNYQNQLKEYIKDDRSFQNTLKSLKLRHL